jgi:hypothetical protein
LVANKDFNVHIVVESLRKKIMSQSAAALNSPNLSLYLFCHKKLLSTSDSSPAEM